MNMQTQWNINCKCRTCKKNSPCIYSAELGQKMKCPIIQCEYCSRNIKVDWGNLISINMLCETCHKHTTLDFSFDDDNDYNVIVVLPNDITCKCCQTTYKI